MKYKYELVFTGKDEAIIEANNLDDISNLNLSLSDSYGIEYGQDKTKRGKKDKKNKITHKLLVGDNLQILKLMQKDYKGRIKLIYTDPPYNTGKNDVIYKNKYGVGKRSRNKINNAKMHCSWMGFIYSRLILAKELLSDDGIIFISIDHREVHNLTIIMNEIFGQENYLANIAWQHLHSTKPGNRHFSTDHEYILVYAKNKTNPKCIIKGFRKTEEQLKNFINPDNDPRGKYILTPLLSQKTGGTGGDKNYDYTFKNGQKFIIPQGNVPRHPKHRLKELEDDNRIVLDEKGKKRPKRKTFYSEMGDKADYITARTLWRHEDAGHAVNAYNDLKKIFNDTKGIFDYPKPMKLMKRIINLAVDPHNNDIILDFFAGSGTTAAAVVDLNSLDQGNRQCIAVQIDDVIDKNTIAYKNGFSTIDNITKQRIINTIDDVKSDNILDTYIIN